MNEINKSIDELIKIFLKIKNEPLKESLRKGTTGIGYTFESSLGKKEDTSFLPDFKGIEIKTKLGYSKSKLTLFCLTPIMEKENAIKFLINNYGYPNKKNKKFNSFKGDLFFKNNNLIGTKFNFRLKVEENKLRLYVLNLVYQLINNNIFWDLDEIKNRLETKLKYLAIIQGFPYNKNGKNFYKYTNMSIYKLKDFNTFINLLTENIISITFNIDTFLESERYGEVHDHGTAFKISLNNIDKLFTKIY